MILGQVRPLNDNDVNNERDAPISIYHVSENGDPTKVTVEPTSANP